VVKGKPRGTTEVESTYNGSLVVRQGRLDCVSSSQEHSMKSLKLKGDYQAHVHVGQMVLVVVRQGGWIALGVVKGAQRKVGKRP
jgi:hypothetical protein